MTYESKLIEVRKILLKALRYKWEAYDNAHTVGIQVDQWAREIDKVYEGKK